MESASALQAVSLVLLGILVIVSFLMVKSDKRNPVHVGLGLVSSPALMWAAFWTQSRLYELQPDLYSIKETISTPVAASFIAGTWAVGAAMMFLGDLEKSFASQS